jgi:predicted transposase YbfD/YdcC
MSPPLAIRPYFRKLKDPRVQRGRLHRLIDIIVITLCGVISGCETWQEIETFGRHRRKWLQRFLALPHGIPSHDTLERVFDRLDPQVFQACLLDWLRVVSQVLRVRHIAIDGKTLCHSTNASTLGGPLQLVSAWATQNHLLLGQVAVESDSNELTAIPKLLELLDLKGALVTLDALGCQKELAQQIVDGGGDYLLVVKANQPRLQQDIEACLLQALDDETVRPQLDSFESDDHGHGRQEHRSYTILRNPQGIRDQDDWPGLRVIGVCSRQSTCGDQTSDEVRCFIGSRVASARWYAQHLRQHWGIENSFHWQLDVTFGEDDNRVCKRHGAENLALVRRTALSLLKQHPSKSSIACKRLAAALDPAFLEEVLRGPDKSDKL